VTVWKKRIVFDGYPFFQAKYFSLREDLLFSLSSLHILTLGQKQKWKKSARAEETERAEKRTERRSDSRAEKFARYLHMQKKVAAEITNIGKENKIAAPSRTSPFSPFEKKL
jgi:hypothetical protein